MMKQILAQCPRCKSRYKVVAAKVAGKKLRCASCRQAFRIPASAASVDKAVAKRASESDEVEIVEDYEGEVELIEDFGDVDEIEAVEDEFENFDASIPQAVGRPSRALPARVSSRPKSETPEGAPKKENEKKTGTKNTVALVAGLSVAGIGILVGLVLLGTRGALNFSRKVEAPTEFAAYSPDAGRFRCEYPKGWTMKGGGGSGGTPAWATFEQGGVVISVRMAGAVGQAVGSGGHLVDPNEVPEELAPVQAAHVAQKQFVEDNFADYAEDPPRKIETRYGDARRSNFTAKDKLWRSKVRGVRATLSNVEVVNVMCRCPEKDFDTFLPTFERVIKSVEP